MQSHQFLDLSARTVVHSAIILLAIVMAPTQAVPPAAPAGTSAPVSELDAVSQREREFADAFERRDRDAFFSFIHEDATFVSERYILIGREAIETYWTPLIATDTPPFAWSPGLVCIGENGTTAQSIGRITGGDGGLIGIFSTTWKKEDGGEWKVMVDHGLPIESDSLIEGVCRGN